MWAFSSSVLAQHPSYTSSPGWRPRPSDALRRRSSAVAASTLDVDILSRERATLKVREVFDTVEIAVRFEIDLGKILGQESLKSVQIVVCQRFITR